MLRVGVRYTAAVEDAQRAVRFVRQHAKQYRIGPERIGGMGGSSGGHLVSMLGTLDREGDPEDPDPVNHESSKLQCVVARAAPSELARIKTETGLAAVTSFIGNRLQGANPAAAEHKRYREASPVKHVSADDAPFLLINGDADRTVPFEQAELMEAALRKADVEVRLIRIPGGGHGGNFAGATNPPDFLGEMVRWLHPHLEKAVAEEAAPGITPTLFEALQDLFFGGRSALATRKTGIMLAQRPGGCDRTFRRQMARPVCEAEWQGACSNAPPARG